MATYPRTMRRGLPRHPGGNPWPPSTTAPTAVDDPSPVAEPDAPPVAALAVAVTPVVPGAEPLAPSPSAAGGVSGVAGSGAGPDRRDLPRITGGEPSPAAGTAVSAVAAAVAPAARTVASGSARVLRRGLPRTPAGAPWPPAGTIPPVPVPVAEAKTQVAGPAGPHNGTSRPAPAAVVAGVDLSVPLPFPRTVWPGHAARTPSRAAPEPARYGRFTVVERAGILIIGGAGLLLAAAMAVLCVRFLLSTDPFQNFLAAYPGEYPLPDGAPVGIPPWLAWQHFFNVFLIVLIIRSGLRVRTDKRPNAFWSPRNNPRRKISLNLWFHQSLDILWISNGLVYVVLLFVTGQWMKIVPTSWAVFPNAISAGLQYLSLDWPTENGWVNYNSLQQLAYFATVFLAAPLAITTGVRMSGIWPKNATSLNRAYPLEWARAIHLPVMLYFVAFITAHIALVLATGALRNLNHMYASQDTINWVGFWIFAASLAVITIGWIVARPLVLAPIARAFGTVSSR